jgi:hypothetical protein
LLYRTIIRYYLLYRASIRYYLLYCIGQVYFTICCKGQVRYTLLFVVYDNYYLLYRTSIRYYLLYWTSVHYYLLYRTSIRSFLLYQDKDPLLLSFRTSTVWSNLILSLVLLCQVNNSRLLATAALRKEYKQISALGIVLTKVKPIFKKKPNYLSVYGNNWFRFKILDP